MPTQTLQEAGYLNADELQSVMKDAIARHGQAQRQAEDGATRVQSLSTLDDALAIARDLDIPEEHVLEAVRDRNAAKLREQRRVGIRAGRRNAFWLWMGGAAGFTAFGAIVAAIT